MVQLVFAQFQRRPKSAKLVPTQALIQLVVVRNERQSSPSLTQHTDAMHLVILPIKELAVKLIVLYNYRRWANRAQSHFGKYILEDLRDLCPI